MTDHAVATLIKYLAIAAVAIADALGLEWVALAAALLGATLSLHLEPAATPARMWVVLLRVLALGFLASLLASTSSHLPTILGFSANEVPIAVRAGLLGIFAGPIYKRLRHETTRRYAPPGD